MIARAADMLHEVRIDELIGIVLADGGNWNLPAISEVRQGIDNPSAPRTGAPHPAQALSRQGEEARRIQAALSRPEGQAL